MMRNTFRYYSKNKKLFFRFTTILTISLLTILFSLYMQVHMFEIKKQQNELLYGSWQGAMYNASQESTQIIKENKMVDTIGSMYVIGDVPNGSLLSSSIGYVNSDFLKMANLQLKDGHFPEKKNEIAIEKMRLDQMGLDYTLGQTVSLQIVRENEIFEKDYILSGIIENYSSTWQTKGRLISYFVMEDTELDSIETEIFFTVMDGYLESIDDLYAGVEGKMVVNTNVEFTYDPMSSQNLPFTLLSIFSILYCLMLLIYILRQWTRSHSREIQMLKALGTSVSMFNLDFLRLLGKSILLPLILFGMASIYLSIPIELVGISLGIYITSLSLVLISCGLLLSRIPVNINSFGEDTQIVHKTIKVKYKKITPFRLFIRSFRFHWKQELIQIGICCLLLTFLYTALTHTIQGVSSLKRIEKEPDIIVSSGSVVAYSIENLGVRFTMPALDNTIVDQFITNKAIKKYKISYSDMKYSVDWEGIKNSPIFQNIDNIRLQSSVSYDWNHELKAFLPIYSQYDNEYYDFLKNHIDEGKWNQEDFEKGNSIYIYIPKYTQEVILDETNLEQYYWDSNPDTFYDKNYVFQDTTLKVGDTITFQAQGEPTKKCKVEGIIREYYSYEDTSIPNNIYQIFVSKGFFEQENAVNTIQLYFNEDETVEMLESHYATKAMQNKLVFINQSQEKRRQRENVRNDIILYGVICLGILFILIFTQVLFASQKRKETRYQYKVLHQLGISNSIFSKIQRFEIVIKIPIIIIVSFISFVGIQYIEYLPQKRLMNSFSTRFSSDFWSWKLFVLIEIIFVIIYAECLHSVYKKERRKEDGTNHFV